MTEAFPLRWPDGWQKTPRDKRDRGLKFSKGPYMNRTMPTFESGRRQVMEELRRLGAHSVVISTNVRLRADGGAHAQVNANSYRMDDPGVAIYFTFNNKQMVMAQDVFDSTGCNLRSLALAVESLRALERHGGRAMMSRGFDGFAALPPPEGSKPRRPWWEVLKYPADPTEREFLSVREIEIRTQMLAKKAHPDAGGSSDAMTELNAAKEDAIRDLESAAGAIPD